MKTLEIIAGIVELKTTAKKYPTHALELEVIDQYPEAANELAELERSGIIKFGHTINDRYITVLQ